MDSDVCTGCGSSILHHETVSYTPLQAEHLENFFSLSEGEAFTERYTILGEIGRGGMGIVYKAKDKVLNTSVALKIINPLISSNPDAVHRFKQETLLARSITHENVVRIHDIGEFQKLFYLSMDLIEGQNLKKLLVTQAISTLEEKLEITKQICHALKAAHQEGIVHRDLKPQNILVDKKGRILVSDFGLAKSLEVPDTVVPEGIVGTPPYMSPEQAQGMESDQRSDIYSLGIILYEMFSGERPFEAETRADYLRKHIQEKPKPLSETAPEIPDKIQKIISTCLEKNVDDRFKTIDEILTVLEPREKVRVPEEKAGPRRYIWGAVLVLAMIAIAVLAYVQFWPKGEAESPVLPESARISVAVMRFENNTGDDSLDNLRSAVQNYLFHDLFQSKFLRVFPDDSLQQVLTEMGASKDGEYSAEMLNQIAERFSIQYFILGSIDRAGDNIWISAVVREAQSNAILETVRASGKGVDDIDLMVDDLTKKIKVAFNLTAAQITADIDGDIGQIYTPSLEAFELFTAGRRLLYERRQQEAAEALEKAVKIDPEFAMAYLILSEAYDEMEQLEKGRENILLAIKYNNRVSERNRLIIQGYAAISLENSYLKSIETFKQLVDLYPHDVEAHGYLAWMHRITEDWEKALIHYEVLANSKDIINRGLAYDNLTFVNLARGAYPEAINVLLENQDAFSNQSFYYRYLSNAYLCADDFDAAYDAAAKALDIEPDAAENHRMMGNVHLIREDFEKAKQSYHIMIEGKEGYRNLMGHFWLANLHLTLGQYQECRRLCYEGIPLARKAGNEGDEAELWLLLCQLENQRDNYEKVDDLSKTLMEIGLDAGMQGFQLMALHWRGAARLKLGRVDEARTLAEELRQLIEGFGVNKLLRYHSHLLGLIDEEEGSLDRALQHFEDALAMLPEENFVTNNHGLFVNSVARIQAKRQDYSEAWKGYEQLSRLTVGRLNWGDMYGLSFYELGKIAQIQDRRDAAIENYKRFLSLWSDADADLESVKDAREQLAKLESSR